MAAKYRYRTIHNHGNMSIVPYTVEIYNRQGYIVKRWGGWSRNRLLSKAYRWADKH